MYKAQLNPFQSSPAGAVLTVYRSSDQSDAEESDQWEAAAKGQVPPVTNVFVSSAKCICSKRKMYLFQAQKEFVQSAKCISFKCKMYLFKVLNVFVKQQNVFFKAKNVFV